MVDEIIHNNESKNITQMVTAMKGQINSMLEEWAAAAYSSYMSNGNDLKISLKLCLTGDSTNITVKSGISFLVEKITDERDGEIHLGQEKLI